MAHNLDKLMGYIDKKFGGKSGSSTSLIFDPNAAVTSISSGSVIVDSVGGYGGLAVRGRLTEIIGMEHSGKTTLCLQTCATAQKKEEGIVLYMDYEQTFDLDYASALGVDLNFENFLVVQPRTAEQGEMILDEAFRLHGKDIALVVIDSVAACRPAALVSKEAEANAKVGAHASYWTNFSFKLTELASTYNTAILLTNQIRVKIETGYMAGASVTSTGGAAGVTMAKDFTTTGGQALRHNISVRYLLRHSGSIKEKVSDPVTGEILDQEVANWITVRNLKNKVRAPFRQIKAVVRYGKGFDDTLPIIDKLKEAGIINRTGSWFEYQSSNEMNSFRCNGETALLSQIKSNVSLFNELKDVYVKLSMDISDASDMNEVSNSEDVYGDSVQGGIELS